MKKNILFIFIFLCLLNFAQSQNKKSGKNIVRVESGFDIFFKQNIGKEIVICISNIDITISGILISVHKNSIIIQSSFNKIFIPKKSIAFAKIKKINAKSQE